jgi:hypothetical protein
MCLLDGQTFDAECSLEGKENRLTDEMPQTSRVEKEGCGVESN